MRALGRANRATRLRSQQTPAQVVGPDLLYCSARGWVAVLGIGGLTSHSSRCRFAARLNSGVRPLSQHRCSRSVVSGLLPLFRGSCLAPRTRGERHRQQRLSHLGFGQARLRRKYDHPESAPCGLAVRVLGRAGRTLGFVLSGTARRPQVVVVFGSGVGPYGTGAGHRRPNESFKPMPLRGTA